MSERYMEDSRYKEVEELLNAPWLLQIPSDPQPEEIIEILAKNPVVISYISNIIGELEVSIQSIRLLIAKRKRELESLKSDVRLLTIKRYKQELENCLLNEMDRIKELMLEGYNRGEAKEIVRLSRPEKPREADLADVADRKTRQFVIDEIEPLEQRLLDYQKQLNGWKEKYNLFENNFRASQTIKGLIQKDRNNFNY